MATVASWKINQLFDYETSHRFQDGLKACEKLLKRYPNDAGLLVHKARFLFGLGDADECIKRCKDLCNRQPPIDDVAKLRTIYQTLIQMMAHAGSKKTDVENDLTKLWQSAIESQPQNSGKLYEAWIEQALPWNRWEDIQQAAQQAQRTFRNDAKLFRHYYFCSLAAGNIATSLNNRDDSLKLKTISAITLKRIQKSAHNTVSPPSTSVAECTIQSYAELLLLYEIYHSQDQAQDIRGLLRDEVLGIHSALGQNDWDFIKRVFDILRQQNLWQELKDCTEDLLLESIAPKTQSQMIEKMSMLALSKLSEAEIDAAELKEWVVQDLNLWKNYAESIKRLGDFDSLHPEILGKNQKEAAASRGQALARLIVLSAKLVHLTSQTGQDLEAEEVRDLMAKNWEACSGALKTNSQTWFEDTKPFLERIQVEERAHVKGWVQDLRQFMKPIEPQVISLKLDYLWCGSEEDLMEVVGAGLQLARSTAARKSRLDEVFLLPVVGLIRLHNYARGEPRRGQAFLLLALCLLEFVVERFPTSHQGAAALVRLSRYLSFRSPWLEKWENLGVKNILTDALSHLVVERISITQPYELPRHHGAGATGVIRDPVEMLSRLYKDLERGGKQLQAAQGQAIREDKWNMLYDLQISREQIERSITLRMIMLERRRIQRLRGEFYDGLGRPNSFSTNTWDNRDMTALLNYEPSGKGSLLDYLSIGPPITPYWGGFSMVIDELDCILTDQKSRALWGMTHRNYAKFKEEDKQEHEAEFTVIEYATIPVWGAIRKLVLHLDEDSKKPFDLKALLNNIIQNLDEYKLPSDNFVVNVDGQPLLPDAAHIGALYIDLELFRACAKLIAYVKQKTKNDQKYYDLFGKIKTIVEALHGRDMAFVQEWSDHLEVHDLTGQMHAAEFGELVANIVGENSFNDKGRDYHQDAVHALKSWLVLGNDAAQALARS